VAPGLVLARVPRPGDVLTGALSRGVYVFTLVASAMTAALLIAPVAVHRLLFQRGRKRELVRVGHRLALSGLLSLVATMLAGMLLVLDVVGRIAAVSAAGLPNAKYANEGDGRLAAGEGTPARDSPGV